MDLQHILKFQLAFDPAYCIVFHIGPRVYPMTSMVIALVSHTIPGRVSLLVRL